MKEYFSHDFNARNDTKLTKVFMKHGVSGIGIYWCIIEMLYEESGYLDISEYERIAFELRVNIETIKSIIENFNLFENDGEKFWSNSAISRIKQRMEKSQKARESVMKRWEKYERNTDVKGTKNDSNTSKVKKSKVKENKENNIYIDFIKSFNSITGKKIRVPDKKFKGQLNARLSEGFTIDEILKAVENCKNDKYHMENPKYLTPEFITRADKLQKFLISSELKNNNKSKINDYDPQKLFSD